MSNMLTRKLDDPFGIGIHRGIIGIEPKDLSGALRCYRTQWPT